MTIYGWDASHYDAVPDVARVISEGFAFMTHKAGGDASDAELAAWWTAIKARRTTQIMLDDGGEPYFADAQGRPGILPGAYWVLYPGSASSRADAFLARLDSQCPGWRDGPFILQADCEIWNGDVSTKPGKGDIKAFCDRLRLKAAKYMPIVYASKGQYGDSLAGLGYPLWNARYSVSDRTGTASGLYAAALDAGSGWSTYSGQTPAIWQFTSSATIAGQSTCDANAFRGTAADLQRLLAPGWEINLTMSPADVQDILNGIYRDLNNPDSGISKSLRKNLHLFMDEAHAYAGPPGTRIDARGWGSVSPWLLLEYLFEQVAAGNRTVGGTDTGLSGSVTARLDRIETKTDELAEPTDQGV